MVLISGRNFFQHPMNEGIKFLNIIQDVYAEKEITVA
jgi:DhnA family fructose-bisphosphate aldolase class Ia